VWTALLGFDLASDDAGVLSVKAFTRFDCWSVSEKRLARRLLLLAEFGKASVPATIPMISQETLAEMIGTTRSRVCFFMNRFRKLGFIDYQEGDDLQVHSSLLNIVLRD
jgi:hypothetical protein